MQKAEENVEKAVAKTQKKPNDKKPTKKSATRNDGIRHSSIVTDAQAIPTVAGPILGWKCCAENLPNHPTMAFFGKRRTGKSTTITNILYHCCQNIPFGIVMSDTAYAGYWDKILPKRHIVQGLRQDVLEWLIERQKKAVTKYGIKGM